jgi:hypothetical protein
VHAELARHHHHQQEQPSNTNPSHYLNVPYSVPQSTVAASNYHPVSDSNANGNAMAGESTYYGSDSASSSAASSFVHLPLVGDVLEYDNVRFFFCGYMRPLFSLASFMDDSVNDCITAGCPRAEIFIVS